MKIIIPSQTITIPAQEIDIPDPVTTPPPIPVASLWLYTNGQNNIAGDFTDKSVITVDYHHATTAGLDGHSQDILINSTVNWGDWIPYFAANYNLPNPGYTALLLSIKPSVTGQAFGIHMEKPGDIDPGKHLELLNYGPPTVAGQWGSYVIPLADLGTFGDPTLYKFVLQDHAAHPSTWEMDNVGLQ